MAFRVPARRPVISPAMWRTLLRTHMASIERILVQWSAGGRVDGAVAPHPSHRKPPRLETSPELTTLEAALEKARAACSRADSSLRSAHVQRSAAKQALATAEEEAAKIAKPPPPPVELREALSACDSTVAKRLALAQAAREKLMTARKAVAHARVDVDAHAQKQEILHLDLRLRDTHREVTGREMPCRVPSVVHAAWSQIRTHPELVRLTFEDLRRLMLTLGIGRADSFRALFVLLQAEDKAVAMQRSGRAGAYQNAGGVAINPPALGSLRTGSSSSGIQASAEIASAGLKSQRGFENSLVSLSAMRRLCGLDESFAALANVSQTPSLLPPPARAAWGSESVSSSVISGSTCRPTASRTAAREAPTLRRPRSASAAVARATVSTGLGSVVPHRAPPRPASGSLIRSSTGEHS